jgi:hypothetical protein
VASAAQWAKLPGTALDARTPLGSLIAHVMGSERHLDENVDCVDIGDMGVQTWAGVVAAWKLKLADPDNQGNWVYLDPSYLEMAKAICACHACFIKCGVVKTNEQSAHEAAMKAQIDATTRQLQMAQAQIATDA